MISKVRFSIYLDNLKKDIIDLKNLNYLSIILFISLLIAGIIPAGYKLLTNVVLFFPLFIYMIISLFYFGTKTNKLSEYKFFNFNILFLIFTLVLCCFRFLETSEYAAFYYMIYPSSILVASLYVFINKKIEVNYIIIFLIITYDIIWGLIYFPIRSNGAFASILSGAVILPLLLLISNHKSKLSELLLFLFISFDIIFLKKSAIGAITILFVYLIISYKDVYSIYYKTLSNKFHFLYIFIISSIAFVFITYVSFIFPREADFVRAFNLLQNFWLINFIPAGVMTSGSFAGSFFNTTNNEGFIFQTFYEIGILAIFYWFFIFFDRNHFIGNNFLVNLIQIIFFQLYVMSSFFISGVFQNPFAFIILILTGFQLFYRNEKN